MNNIFGRLKTNNQEPASDDNGEAKGEPSDQPAHPPEFDDIVRASQESLVKLALNDSDSQLSAGISMAQKAPFKRSLTSGSSDLSRDLQNTCELKRARHGVNERIVMKGLPEKLFSKTLASLTEKEHEELMSSLNRQNMIYITSLLDQLKKGDQFFHYINGPHGTGKRFLARAIFHIANHYYQQSQSCAEKQGIESVNADDDLGEFIKPNAASPKGTPRYVLLSSYTGRGAYQIGGKTLYSCLNMSFSTMASVSGIGDTRHTPCSNKCDSNELLASLKDLKLLIVNNFHQLSALELTHVNKRLQALAANNSPFGGVSIVALGDFNFLEVALQEKKVKTSYLFVSPLWHNFKLYQLEESALLHKEFGAALGRLGRDGFHGLTPTDVIQFDKRICTVEDVPRSSIWLHNSNIFENNDKLMKKLPVTSKQLMQQATYILKNIVYAERDNYAKAKADVLQHIKTLQAIYIAGGLASRLKLKVGAKYAITYNIAIDDGLINGAIGTLMHIEVGEEKFFEAEQLRTENENAVLLFLKFADLETGRKARETFLKDKADWVKYLSEEVQHHLLTEKDWVPIIKQTAKIEIDQLRKETFTVHRRQFPLNVANAIPIRSAQGHSFDALAIDLSVDKLSRAELYTALTAAKNGFDSIYLVSNTPFSSLIEYYALTPEQHEAKAAKRSAKNEIHTALHRMENAENKESACREVQ